MLKKGYFRFPLRALLCFFLLPGISYSQIIPDTIVHDTAAVADTATLQSLSRKRQRQIKKEMRWDEFRQSHRHFLFQGNLVYALLDTRIDFSITGTVLHAVIGLENNLNLPNKSMFVSGSFLWRFTPSSGLYLNYYGLNRSRDYATKHDLPWGGDTIPAGTPYTFFFNTQVISVGYVFSIFNKPNTFLGAYFNVYVMLIRTGLTGQNLVLTDATMNATVPLPNLGLLTMFQLTKWLSVNGNIGVFSLYTDALGGYIQDIKLSLVFKATPWLAFSVSFQKFYVHAIFPDTKVNTVVDYDFHGPSAGIVFIF
jgi:hypothetical protein